MYKNKCVSPIQNIDHSDVIFAGLVYDMKVHICITVQVTVINYVPGVLNAHVL